MGMRTRHTFAISLRSPAFTPRRGFSLSSGRLRSHAIMRATERNRGHRQAERRLSHKVDLAVPGSGFGRRLTGMLGWCRENIAAGAWDRHGHNERIPGETPAEFARLCLDSADWAEMLKRHRLQ